MKDKVKAEIQINDDLSAPIKQNDVIGRVSFSVDGNEIGGVDIYSVSDAPRIKFGEIFREIFIGGAMF